MSRKVGIIGMGHVGSTVAHGLIAQGAFDDYVLIDINEKKLRRMLLILQMRQLISISMLISLLMIIKRWQMQML